MGQSAQAKTWQKKLAQRRKAQFIGRWEPLRLFTDNFVGAEPEYLAYVVTGEGGVGKSTLLEQFVHIARAHDALPIICDERHLSPADAMGHVAAELAGQQIEYKPFNERYKKYRELRQEVEGDAKAPRAAVDVLVRGITDVTVKGLRRAPGVGLAFDLVDAEAAGKGLSELVQYGINRWGNKDEVQLLRDPAAVLTPLFVTLLNQACARQRLVLMFDVFERTGPTLSDWLLALCKGEYGDFSLALSFVISGRDPLEQH